MNIMDILGKKIEIKKERKVSTFDELLSAEKAELTIDIDKQALERAKAKLLVEIEAAKVVAGEAHAVATEKQAIVDALVAQLPIEPVEEPVVEAVETPVEPELTPEVPVE